MLQHLPEMIQHLGNLIYQSSCTGKGRHLCCKNVTGWSNKNLEQDGQDSFPKVFVVSYRCMRGMQLNTMKRTCNLIRARTRLYHTITPSLLDSFMTDVEIVFAYLNHMSADHTPATKCPLHWCACAMLHNDWHDEAKKNN
jgi:hypothetical protein